MNTAASSEDSPADDPRIDATTVDRMRRGDEDAWRRFLTDYHALFVRAVRAASWRIFKGAAVTRAVSLEELTDDAKTYFYRAFLRSFREFDGEGRFRAFLFRTIQNCLMERFRLKHHEVSLTPADADEIVEWSASTTPAAAGPSSEALYRCLERLTHLYRSVVLLRIEAPERSLNSLAAVFGVSVEAIHKRYQRALALLKDCLERRSESRDDV